MALAAGIPRAVRSGAPVYLAAQVWFFAAQRWWRAEEDEDGGRRGGEVSLCSTCSSGSAIKKYGKQQATVESSTTTAASSPDTTRVKKKSCGGKDADAGKVYECRFCSLKSVRAFADQFNSMNLPLNILINNAGVMLCPFQLSKDEIEMQFATNHLGHFLLTNLLLDNMKATAKSMGIEGRIVNMSSVTHLHAYPAGIQFDKLNDKKVYNDKLAYGQSKLANILHARAV